MGHPVQHAKSSVKKWGGEINDYLPVHQWFDQSKAWVGSSLHRMFRHHSEGIFEAEQMFGKYIINSDNRVVYVRYIGEQHVREDCNGHIPSAKEWLMAIEAKERPLWMLKTLPLED